MSKLVKILKAAGVGIGLGLFTTWGAGHIARSGFKDASAIEAREKAWRNASYNGDPISTYVSTYTDSAFNDQGSASVWAPLLGLGVGYLAGRRMLRKKEDE